MAQTSRIELKSSREIDFLRKAGQVSAQILMALKAFTEAGMTTKDVDAMAAKMMKEHGATPSFLNYRGYPAVVCTSVNEEIVHSIPNSRRLVDGDLLSLDIGMFIDGYCGDTATSSRMENLAVRNNALRPPLINVGVSELPGSSQVLFPSVIAIVTKLLTIALSVLT